MSCVLINTIQYNSLQEHLNVQQVNKHTHDKDFYIHEISNKYIM